MTRLTCTEDGASKFWEGDVKGAVLTVRFGKIGAAGQTKTKKLASPAAAQKELAWLVQEKRGKGYIDAPHTPAVGTKATSVDEAVPPMLGHVVSALGEEDGAKALALLLSWWRSGRHDAIGQIIARVAALHPQDDEVARALPLVGLRIADAEARARKLAVVDPDPRIADAAAALLLEMPYVSEGAKPMWTEVMALLPRHGDGRHAALAAELPRQWKIRGDLREWLVRHIERSVLALRDRLPPAPLGEAVRSQLDALAPARAVPPLPGARDEAALLSAIYADPDDDGARLVYSDLLLERGDPRGEFIALQCKKQPAPQDEERIRELLKEHESAWVGPLAPVLLKGVVFRRGFPAEGRVGFHDAKGAEKYGSHPAWATFESLDYPHLTTAKDQKQHAQHVDPAMRNLRAISGLTEPGLRNLLALDVTWRLESLSAYLHDLELAEVFARSERFPSLRRLKGVFPVEMLKSARWAGQLTHIRVLDMESYKELLADAYVAFPKLVELSATSGSSEKFGITRATRDELPRPDPNAPPRTPKKKPLTAFGGLAWSRDGAKIYATAGQPHPSHLIVVDASALEERERHELGSPLWHLRLSPDSNELLSFDYEGPMVLHLDGTRRLRLTAPRGGQGSLGWSHDGARFFAAGRDIFVYDRQGTQLAKIAGGPAAAFSPDGARVAWVEMAGYKPTGIKARAVDAKRSVALDDSAFATSVVWTSGGFAARGFLERGVDRVALWDVDLGRRIGDFRLEGHGETALSDDGRWMVASTPGTLQIASLPDGAVRKVDCEGGITGLAFSPDGSRLGVVLSAGLVILETRSGKELGRFPATSASP